MQIWQNILGICYISFLLFEIFNNTKDSATVKKKHMNSAIHYIVISCTHKRRESRLCQGIERLQ